MILVFLLPKGTSVIFYLMNIENNIMSFEIYNGTSVYELAKAANFNNIW